MKLIILFGPPAVGKMTVGMALAKRTGLKLLYNHMTLELVNQFFPFGTTAFERLDKSIRFDIFREIASSDLKGLIFTLVWAINYEEDEQYVDEITEIFNNHGGEVLLVELKAHLSERLRRNKEELRLYHKPSKRDLETSEKSLISFEENYVMNSTESDFPDKDILRIENTNLSPDEVVEIIINHYKLDAL
jgi:cytidylate kinase